MKDFVKIAKENGDVKKYSEVYNTDPNILEECDRLFYIGEKTIKYPRYEIGDIIYIKDYENNKYINNHLFVIVDDDNYGVPIDYFCIIISSNLDKLKFKTNKLLEKDNDIKYDEISFCVGKVPMEYVNEYEKLYLENKDVK